MHILDRTRVRGRAREGLGSTGVRAGLIKVMRRLSRHRRPCPVHDDGSSTGSPSHRCADRRPPGTGHGGSRRTGPALRGVGGRAAAGDPRSSGPFTGRVVQREAARAGAFLTFDGPSRANHATDWRLPEQLTALTEDGFGGQLLLGGDTTVPETPGMPYLLRRLRPRLERTLGMQALDGILVGNAARAFAWRTSSVLSDG